MLFSHEESCLPGLVNDMGQDSLVLVLHLTFQDDALPCPAPQEVDPSSLYHPNLALWLQTGFSQWETLVGAGRVGGELGWGCLRQPLPVSEPPALSSPWTTLSGFWCHHFCPCSLGPMGGDSVLPLPAPGCLSTLCYCSETCPRI